MHKNAHRLYFHILMKYYYSILASFKGLGHETTIFLSACYIKYVHSEYVLIFTKSFVALLLKIRIKVSACSFEITY
jgi:hypothetical protein